MTPTGPTCGSPSRSTATTSAPFPPCPRVLAAATVHRPAAGPPRECAGPDVQRQRGAGATRLYWAPLDRRPSGSTNPSDGSWRSSTDPPCSDRFRTSRVCSTSFRAGRVGSGGQQALLRWPASVSSHGAVGIQPEHRRLRHVEPSLPRRSRSRPSHREPRRPPRVPRAGVARRRPDHRAPGRALVGPRTGGAGGGADDTVAAGERGELPHPGRQLERPDRDRGRAREPAVREPGRRADSGTRVRRTTWDGACWS